MPAQLPVASIISTSKLVRCSRRWASSSLPALLSSSSRTFSSCWISFTAWERVGFGVT